ncbi:hypothetical protein QGM71_14330 [Virgibacillus sp. C22-A2]|uniref:Uncharacterized protein n=1 Tax=Virgibacillus tibetensis TaxID=3042313 RepID=A0ABU6KIJ5_9BACI|nr:hypothetical protein [Virgibacillus sp. C22-A2]
MRKRVFLLVILALLFSTSSVFAKDLSVETQNSFEMTGEEKNQKVSPSAVLGPDGRHKVQNTSLMPYRALTFILVTGNG